MPRSGQVARVSSSISLSGVELCLQTRHFLAQGLDLGAYCRGLAHDVRTWAFGRAERILGRDLGHDLPIAVGRGVPVLNELLLLLAPRLALIHYVLSARLGAGCVRWERRDCGVRPACYHISQGNSELRTRGLLQQAGYRHQAWLTRRGPGLHQRVLRAAFGAATVGDPVTRVLEAIDRHQRTALLADELLRGRHRAMLPGRPCRSRN